MMVRVASKSTFPLGSPVDVICGSLPAKLYPDKLIDGYSHCILFSASGRSLMTPCEYQRRAGRTTAKNWKKTIRYKGRSIDNFLQCHFSADGKKQFHFVTSSPQNSREPWTRSSQRNSAASPTSPVVSSPETLSSPLCHLLHPQQVLIHQLLHQPTVTNHHLSHHQIYQSSPLCHLLHQQQVLIYQLLHQ